MGSGLGITRHSGTVSEVVYEGVKNGVVKILDEDTGYSYLTATDENGQFIGYVLDCAWSLVGTSTETEILDTYSLKLEMFDSSYSGGVAQRWSIPLITGRSRGQHPAPPPIDKRFCLL